MGKGRLEAFSDGVIAIIITIMVLELKLPQHDDLDALLKIVPELASYLLSFVFVGIYWNNHHHMMHATERVSGAALWANLHLLFWLSLIPFGNNWLWNNPTSALPTAFYGVVLLMSGAAYAILARALVRVNGADSLLAKALDRDRDLKGRISLALYAAAIVLAFLRPWISDLLYVCVALIWFVPDRRIERQIES